MAGINNEKLKQMEAEMNRFEAEIALPVLPPPPPPPLPQRQVIGSRTYSQVQKQLEQQHVDPSNFIPLLPPPPPPNLPGAFGSIPPPPMPPTMFIPHQVQRVVPHVRHPATSTLAPPATVNTVPSPNFPQVSLPRTFSQHMAGPPPPSGPDTLPQNLTVSVGGVLSVLSSGPKIYAAKPVLLKGEQNGDKGSLKVGTTSDVMAGPTLPPTQLTPIESVNYTKKAPLHKKISEMAFVAKEIVERPKDATVDEGSVSKRKEKKNKKLIRTAGGQTWEDNSLQDWDPDDFRIFCGDLGNDVTDEVLTRAFGRYPSFVRAKVIRDKRTNKTKGYGFVSFKDPQDFIKAMKEMNGRYVGSRPIKLRKSCWKSRNLEIARRREREKAALIGLVSGR